MSSLEALSVDNKRLKSELQYYCKCIELDFYFVIQSLENQYKTSLRPDHQFEYQLSPKHSSLADQSSLGTTPTASAVDNESSFVAQNLFNDFMCKTEESTDYSEDDSEDDDEDNEDEESSDGECLPDNSQVWPPIATTATTVANTRAPKRRTGRQPRTRRGPKAGTTSTAPTGRKPKPHACDWIGCGKTFRDNLALTAHVRLRHTNERPFACDKCPKSFADKKHLTQHLKYHTSQERYKCKYTDCPFETRHPKNLSEHYVRHTKVRNFRCDQSECGKSFITKKDLKRHESTVHSDERPYGCDWPGCEASFKNRQHWNNHRLTHSGVRQFKCEFVGCAKSFVTRNTLFQHKQEHIKPYVCVWPACGQRFGNNRSLKTHINEHQGIRPFKCEFSACFQSFYSKPQLNQHVKSAHKYTLNNT